MHIEYILMNKFSIYTRIMKDDFVFIIDDVKNIEVLSLITEGNPGSVTVMLELYRTYQTDEIVSFLNKIWKHKIVGARLWYIYKNECNHSVLELLSKDLTPFTKSYFYEKFEKYI